MRRVAPGVVTPSCVKEASLCWERVKLKRRKNFTHDKGCRESWKHLSPWFQSLLPEVAHMLDLPQLSSDQVVVFYKTSLKTWG